MSDLNRGLSRVAYSLGEIIDPVGHAKDKARMRRMAALNNECPRCGARRGHKCVTRSGQVTHNSHTSRLDKA
jgi:hypothetical protein